MPLAIADLGNMSSCVIHVVKVHVTSNSCLSLYPFDRVDPCLVIRTADEDIITRGTEADCSDWMSIKRFEVFVGPQVLIHSLKIIKF